MSRSRSPLWASMLVFLSMAEPACTAMALSISPACSKRVLSSSHVYASSTLILSTSQDSLCASAAVCSSSSMKASLTRLASCSAVRARLRTKSVIAVTYRKRVSRQCSEVYDILRWKRGLHFTRGNISRHRKNRNIDFSIHHLTLLYIRMLWINGSFGFWT